MAEDAELLPHDSITFRRGLGFRKKWRRPRRLEQFVAEGSVPTVFAGGRPFAKASLLPRPLQPIPVLRTRATAREAGGWPCPRRARAPTLRCPGCRRRRS